MKTKLPWPHLLTLNLIFLGLTALFLAFLDRAITSSDLADSEPQAVEQTRLQATGPEMLLKRVPPSEPFEMAEPADAAAEDETVLEGVLKRGETLTTALRRIQVPEGLLPELLDALGDNLDMRKLKPGDTVEVVLGPEGDLQRCTYQSGPLDIIAVSRCENGLEAKKLEVPLESRTVLLSGTLDSSLFAAFVDRGESTALVFKVADLFASRIDFNTEIQPGDRFHLIVEKLYREDLFVAYGKILAARFTLYDRTLEGYHYLSDTVESGYFDDRGQGIGASFLRSPIPFGGRVTSGFSYSRKHPILDTVRPHLGVDLAAPSGTPVMASGNGKIDFIGRNGGFGKQIVINHPGGYRTHYGHLSGFAKGLAKGSAVRQGQTIGYVGSTGLSTGPHLDYRFQENGRFKDPFAINFPPMVVLRGEELERFQAERMALAQLLDDGGEDRVVEVRNFLYRPDGETIEPL